MGIVFFCQSCGARFEVDPRMAGKNGRCRKCGQMIAIPRGDRVASLAAMPAMAGAAAGDRAAPDVRVGTGGGSIGSWLKGGIGQPALAPITLDRIPIGQRKATGPSPFDDAEDSKPYGLAQPTTPHRGAARMQDNVVVRVWRRQLGRVQKLFRKLNQAAYLVSIPFLMILLLGTAVRSRPMALFGATVVVLLNLGRLLTGVANLGVVPFRDGINLDKMKKPLRRVIEPVLTIGLVILAFTFIPWLASGDTNRGSIGDRLRSSAQALKQEMKGQVAKVVDLPKIAAQAQEKLEGLRSAPGSGPAEPSGAGPGNP